MSTSSTRTKRALWKLTASVIAAAVTLGLSGARADGLSATDHDAYIRLRSKASFGVQDYDEILRVLKLDLTNIKANELMNHVSDKSNDALWKLLQVPITDSKNYPKIARIFAAAVGVDCQYVAFARGETSKLTPESIKLFGNLHPDTVLSIKYAVEDTDASELHIIEDFVDSHPASSWFKLGKIKPQDSVTSR